jgi:hypothetical protein
MEDLASRLANRVQLTTDGHGAYLSVVEGAFGWNGVDYAMLVKLYGTPIDASGNPTARRYSPPEVIAIEKHWVMGKPDADEISTSFVERQNLTMRMNIRRLTRLTNGFSKKLENHIHAMALYFQYYNFLPEASDTDEGGRWRPHDPRDGGGRGGSRLEAGGSGCAPGTEPIDRSAGHYPVGRPV